VGGAALADRGDVPYLHIYALWSFMVSRVVAADVVVGDEMSVAA
jgi:hypothetical protein